MSNVCKRAVENYLSDQMKTVDEWDKVELFEHMKHNEEVSNIVIEEAFSNLAFYDTQLSNIDNNRRYIEMVIEAFEKKLVEKNNPGVTLVLQGLTMALNIIVGEHSLNNTVFKEMGVEEIWKKKVVQ